MKGGKFQIDSMLVEQLLEGIEAASVFDFESGVRFAPPISGATHKAYNGFNSFMLSIMGLRYKSPYWFTFKQVSERGGHVKKGESGYAIAFWKSFDMPKTKTKSSSDQEPGIEDEIDDSNEKTGDQKGENAKHRKRFLLRYYRVFNYDQTEGMKLNFNPYPAALGAKNFDLDEAVKRGLEEAKEMGEGICPIVHENRKNGAYSRMSDKVYMPFAELFPDKRDYLATLYHEMIHATGHPDRLNRHKKHLKEEGPKFQSASYSFEEVIAETGAFMMLQQRGLVNEKLAKNTFAYLKGWMSLLEKTNSRKSIVLTGLNSAHKAVSFIDTALEMHREKKREQSVNLGAASREELLGKLDQAIENAPQTPSPSAMSI